MAPFERAPLQIPPAGSDPEFERQAHAQVARLDAIQPTSDPVADFRLYDEVAGTGTLRDNFTTPREALRFLVEDRRSRRVFLEHDDPNVYPLQTEIQAHTIAALDRILEHHGIQSQSATEFDLDHSA